WQRVRLGDICEITTGSLDANEMVHYGKYRFYTCAKEYYFIDKYAFDTEAILISGNGAYVGYVHYYKGKFNAYQRTYVLDNFSEHIIFIKYFLTMFLQSHIQTNRNEGNTPYIVMATLKDFEIPLPPLHEQIAIADILSDLDNYLHALRALTLKKESVKKALSFELLSQGKRLKGFNQDWQRVRLGDICEFGNGGAYETLIVENGDFKLISLNSVDIDGNLKNTMKRVNFYDNSLKQGDIVMVLSDVAHGDFLGLCAVILSNDYVLNQRMGRLRIRNDCINILFLRLYINANQKYFKMQGQGSSQLNLSKKAIEDFEILLPPLNEQSAIADILSTLDKEIESLKNKKSQFENIKKALNHDLMSAKIRVLKK
ncbi:restriction endonuclease subunit S, partial [Helicobacter pylori]|nr:restriction endonuclease subunit S [Helicobacter pylori]